MKEFPILYSTPMVQSILKDNKIMTRRTKGLHKFNEQPDLWFCNGKIDETGIFTFSSDQFHVEIDIKSPYGQPGDLLWVRETFTHHRDFATDTKPNAPFIYKADNEGFDEYPINLNGSIVYVSQRDPWKPSIHMPKSAARIWLQVTEVSIERLHEITDQDAIAEGIIFGFNPWCDEIRYVDYSDLSWESLDPVSSFKSLWSKINGQKSWDSNPWVWVISFEVLSTTGNPNAQASQRLKAKD